MVARKKTVSKASSALLDFAEPPKKEEVYITIVPDEELAPKEPVAPKEQPVMDELSYSKLKTENRHKGKRMATKLGGFSEITFGEGDDFDLDSSIYGYAIYCYILGKQSTIQFSDKNKLTSLLVYSSNFDEYEKRFSKVVNKLVEMTKQKTAKRTLYRSIKIRCTNDYGVVVMFD